MSETIGILVVRSANQALLSEFCAERGIAVRAAENPHSFDVSAWDDTDLFLVDELFASRHGEALLALKQRQPGIFLPVLVLVEPRSSAVGWIDAGFDDVLRMPISKAELGARLSAFLELRRQSIEIARRGEAMFRAIVDQSLVGVYLFTGDTFLYVNQAFADMAGYHVSEIVGNLNPLDLVYPEDKPLVSAQISARLGGKAESARYRFRIMRGDGGIAYWEAFGRRIDYQGQSAILGTAIDITEQVRAEQRLQRVLRALRVLSACNQTIVRATEEAVLLQDICEHLIALGGYRLAWVGMAEQDQPHSVQVVAKAGPAAAFLDGIRVSWKDDKWGRGPTGTAIRTGEPQLNLYPQSAPAYSPWRERALQFGLGASIALPLKVWDTVIGALNIYAETSERFDQEELQLLNELAVDISYGITALRTEMEKEKALRALRDSEERLKALVEHMPAGVVLLDKSNRLELANALAWEYLRILAPDITAGSVLTSLGNYALEELLSPPPEGKSSHEVASAGEERRLFEVVLQTLGEELDPIKASKVLVLQDVTREREIDLRVQEQARLASVGQLAAGIAHDFNNILTAILGYAQLVLYEPGLEPKVRSDLQVIMDQGQRAAHLIRQLLDFSRKSLLQKGPLDIVSFLKEQAKLLGRLLPESIEVHTQFPAESIWVEADPTSLQQAVANLAINARDAMPHGGKLILRIERRVYDTRYTLPPWPDMPTGSWVLIQVKDTGCGIAPEHIPHIFEPFFTTKRAGQGTGLGLSQVYGIVRQHGGYVGVESVLGQGSTFTIYLPEMTVFGKFDITNRASVPQLEKMMGHGERILLVEDDERVRQVCMQALQSAGYQVICASDGCDALEMLETMEAPVDLLITDMVMPRMGGAELLSALHARGIGWPALVMTGYPLDQSADANSSNSFGISHWIMKPFALSALLEKVREILSRVGDTS